MDNKILALKFVLDVLGVPTDITTIDDRKRVQKAIYLGQLSGVDLGYRFGWYLMGPYCPALTRDYFQLAEELETASTAFEGKQLRAPVKELLNKVVPVLSNPSNVKISQEDWLELLASYHYLRVVSKRSQADAIKVMEEQKPHVAPFITDAERILRKYSLLN